MRRTDRPSILAYFATLLSGCERGIGKLQPDPAQPAGKRRRRAEIAATKRGAGGRLPDRLEIPGIDVDIPVVELGWHAAARQTTGPSSASGT